MVPSKNNTAALSEKSKKLSNYINTEYFSLSQCRRKLRKHGGYKEIEGLLEEQFLLLLLPKTDLQCQITMCIYYLFIYLVISPFFFYKGCTACCGILLRTISYSAIKL